MALSVGLAAGPVLNGCGGRIAPDFADVAVDAGSSWPGVSAATGPTEGFDASFVDPTDPPDPPNEPHCPPACDPSPERATRAPQ